MKQRIASLDWLRGAMASAIMIYHLYSWNFHPLGAGSVLGRLGIYGVSVFFILSGLSMAFVYSRFIRDGASSLKFLGRRIFRIWPLMWVCVFLMLVLMALTGKRIDPLAVVVNLTTAFGFFDPAGTMVTGSWSIGNEMVYYCLTPAILLAYNHRRLFGNMIVVATLVVYILFAFVWIGGDSIAAAWHSYVNPFDNLFLYYAGIAIYYNVKPTELTHRNRASLALIVAAIVIFVALPYSGDRIAVVVDEARLLFTLSCLMLVVGAYLFDLYDKVPKFLSRTMTEVGTISYGIYLVHPIVNRYLERVMAAVGFSGAGEAYVEIALTVALTLISAALLFALVERPMILVGKRIFK